MKQHQFDGLESSAAQGPPGEPSNRRGRKRWRFSTTVVNEHLIWLGYMQIASRSGSQYSDRLPILLKFSLLFLALVA